jgi:hypothetical protein
MNTMFNMNFSKNFPLMSGNVQDACPNCGHGKGGGGRDSLMHGIYGFINDKWEEET